jgi:hypothetical protein
LTGYRGGSGVDLSEKLSPHGRAQFVHDTALLKNSAERFFELEVTRGVVHGVVDGRILISSLRLY